MKGVDRNEIARRAFQAGARLNGSGVIVPDRLAQQRGGPGAPAVGVAIPSTDQVDATFSMALAAMQYMIGRMGLPFYLFGMKGDVPAVNRNSAIEQARSHDCEWLLMLDPKVTFPPNGLARLLQAAMTHHFDIVGATSCNRAQPHNNLATGLETGPATVDQFVEVARLPMSFTLLHVPAILALKRPLFRYQTIEEGEAGGPLVVDDASGFCDAARAAGLKVWLDVQLSTQVVSWGDCGYRLTGADDPAAPQYERIELGMPKAEPPEEDEADEPKIQVANG